jgi:putative pyruvate formate lyase activating enzyme
MSSEALSRYYAILDGEETARYLMTKRTEMRIDLRAETDVLWKAHERALQKKGGSGQSGLLDLKIELANRVLKSCELCERKCGANRSAGERGHCRVLKARVNSEFLHMGEEPELVPSYTIFFSGCTFECVFCQNWDISTRPEAGVEIAPKVLARKIEAKSPEEGCGAPTGVLTRARNVNWVGGDPTSNLPFILEVLKECRANIPQVWNSNMYLSERSMQLLDGIIDVYLTDFKYGNDSCASRLSKVQDYLRIVQRNHRTAKQQAEMIVRHLVLPGHVECCTRPALTWISENLEGAKVNVMAQYKPEHNASEYPEISHPLRMAEYRTAMEIAESLGLDLCD